ncbi:peptidoglycan D,D-transpeptidase FtsI family protein [Planifilum fimeticola]
MKGVVEMEGNRKTIKFRILLVCLLIVGLALSITLRLLWIQTVEASDLRKRAEKIWEKEELIEPSRGSITDRNGEPLVRDIVKYIIAADPTQVEDPKKAAEKLSPILNIPRDDLYRKLSNKGLRHVKLMGGGTYKVSRDVQKQVMDLKLEGIYAIPTVGRQYVEGNLAAHVLGFVNLDNSGVGGVEQRYNDQLKGEPGEIRFKKDAKGIRFSDGPEEFRPPRHGEDLILTLDREIQFHVERVLDQAMDRYRAKGATAIVVNPRNGDVLAMANRPTFDPERYATTLETGVNDVNIAISNVYEPGSTFKIVTLAAAIEEGVFHPEQTFQSGSIRVGGRLIRDWNGGRGWGEITYREGVYQSSNVAFVLLGQRLGQDRLIGYIERFGFGRITDSAGRKTGIDLPAEAKGYFFGRRLYESELATTSFGQGIAVTPIQQVMAVSAVANGGTLYKPRVVKAVRDPQTGKLTEYKPKKVTERVISPETAAQVRQILTGVVEQGTGSEAALKEYTVAGKTGTAQKPKNDGGYASDRHFVSFVGFAPAESPQVVVYVALDEPSVESGSVSGGTVAAPVAREILQGTLKALRIKPQLSSLDERVNLD